MGVGLVYVVASGVDEMMFIEYLVSSLVYREGFINVYVFF